ncbi:exonuclease family protein [Cryptosporidium andersoni]|uniref:Exonuclease family protein n=1 Tax=Cryptosporidium andersoni TaxID=117008 RepID=A0A1J4MSZ7_9CRYT|nr:exonuclease family protein [Cryptosporidium andersoni]
MYNRVPFVNRDYNESSPTKTSNFGHLQMDNSAINSGIDNSGYMRSDFKGGYFSNQISGVTYTDPYNISNNTSGVNLSGTSISSVSNRALSNSIGASNWGWEAYTSYNVVGLFSSHLSNKSIRPFITSIFCDPFYELFWLGWTNGFLSSFKFPHCSRYTAFPVGIGGNIINGILCRDNVINVGFPSSSHIYTVSNNGIGVYTRGGSSVSTHSVKLLTDNKIGTKILCSDSTKYSSYIGNPNPFIGLGTSGGVSILDLHELRLIHQIPYNSGISCLKSSPNPTNFVVGGCNMIGIADIRLPRLGQTVTVVSNPISNFTDSIVSGLAVNDYTVAIITSSICTQKITFEELLSNVGGVHGLSVLDLIRMHPGEVSTSAEMMIFKKNLDISNFQRDTTVRLYDIRRFRPRKNIPFSPGPINILWNHDSLFSTAGPGGSGGTNSGNSGFEDLYIIGNNGQWQVYHSNIDQMEFYATPSVPISFADFSSSNQFFILADTSGSIHTMQRPSSSLILRKSDQHLNSPSTDPTNTSNICHPFNLYPSYPLPSIGRNVRLNMPLGSGESSNINNFATSICETLGNFSEPSISSTSALYVFPYVKSIHCLMGIASNPVTKSISQNLGNPTTPNLTVALRYLRGRPVVAYDSLNPVGIPPIIEIQSNGSMKIKEEVLVSFKNLYDVDEIRKIQTGYSWQRFKVSDELPPGLCLFKLNNSGKITDTEASSTSNVISDMGETFINDHLHKSSSSNFLALSLEYIREIRPEIEPFKLKNLEYKSMDFIKVAINPDVSKYKANNLVYGLPLLCIGGTYPTWFYRLKRNTNLCFGLTDALGIKTLSLVPSRFQYRPKTNLNRRDRPKIRRVPIETLINTDNSSITCTNQIRSLGEEESVTFCEGFICLELDNDVLDFTQPLFMLISFIPTIPYMLLMHHVTECEMEFCISCEIVHLSFMLYCCRRSYKQRNQLFSLPLYNNNYFHIFALNILRTLRHLPEVKLVGIELEDTPSILFKPNPTISNPTSNLNSSASNFKLNSLEYSSYLPSTVFTQIRKIEAFWRFLIEQIHKDFVKSSNSTIQDFFGIKITTISSCTPFNHIQQSNNNIFALEMFYPHNLNSSNSNNVSSLSHSSKVLNSSSNQINQDNNSAEQKFLECLNLSLCRIISGRSYCKECSQTSACQHMRFATSLASLLLVNCSLQSVKQWQYYGGTIPLEYDETYNSNTKDSLNNPLLSIPFYLSFASVNKSLPLLGTKICGTNSEIQALEAISIKDSKSVVYNSDNELNTQDYELIALIFGVYQGSSIQLPSGTHFCMYFKHKLVTPSENNKNKWYLMNGSTVFSVNKSEVTNFCNSWKLPCSLVYLRYNPPNTNPLNPFPTINFDSDLSLKSEIMELCETSPKICIQGISVTLPWQYPDPIHSHTLKMLNSIVKLLKNEVNLSENPDNVKISQQVPFTDDELSLLCLHYFIRYPRYRGLIDSSEKFSNSDAKIDFESIDPPMVVALDSEYVALDAEQSILRPDGTKEVLKKSQMSLARVSIVRCGSISSFKELIEEYGQSSDSHTNKTNTIIMDHYVSYGSTSQQPMDYLTRFSGVKPGDLDPKYSSHFLTSKHLILKKLQFMVDSGVVFIGHGLSSDFKIINIYVPCQQIIDTVEIYRLPEERFISLKFLAKFVLNKNIQCEGHDSIEDAKIAYELFLKYLDLKKRQIWNEFLANLYSKGHATDWKVEALDNSQTNNKQIVNTLGV